MCRNIKKRKEKSLKNHPHSNRKIPAQVEQSDTMIHEIQHVPLKFDIEEICKLQEKRSPFCEINGNYHIAKMKK